MPTDTRMKPYLKLASTLVLAGGAIFTFERFGLSQFAGPNPHLPGWLITILVVTPVVLVLAGLIIFMVGRMRRL
jgi:hypothetical protein